MACCGPAWRHMASTCCWALRLSGRGQVPDFVWGVRVFAQVGRLTGSPDCRKTCVGACSMPCWGGPQVFMWGEHSSGTWLPVSKPRESAPTCGPGGINGGYGPWWSHVFRVGRLMISPTLTCWGRGCSGPLSPHLVPPVGLINRKSRVHTTRDGTAGGVLLW